MTFIHILISRTCRCKFHTLCILQNSLLLLLKAIRTLFFFWIITVWIINNTQNHWESSFVLLWWVKSINTLGDTKWFHKLHPIKVRFAHLCVSTNIFTHRIFKWGCECWISDTLHLRSALRGQNTSTSLFHPMVTKVCSRNTGYCICILWMSTLWG